MQIQTITKDDAKAKGLDVYFTGKPCKRGNVANRSTKTGHCQCVACVDSIKQCKTKSHANWYREKIKDDDYREKSLQQSRERYQRNRDHVLKRTRQWAIDNPEKVRKSALEHYHRNREQLLPKKREWAKKLRREQPGKVRSAIIERRHGRKLATPAWADMTKINAIYRHAASLTKITGVPHHVDHIIPLKGENVCGLHVQSNLRVVTAEENMMKSNRVDDHIINLEETKLESQWLSVTFN